MKVLVLSPHTDDVELGAGGTISKLMENGWDTYWMVFSTAEKSLPPDLDKNTLRNEFLDVIGYLENKGQRIRASLIRFQNRYPS